MKTYFSVTLVFFVAILFSLVTKAETKTTATPLGWRSLDGKILPDTEARKGVDGFGGWLVVTPDQDWQKKWETPNVAPYFKEVDTIKKGTTIFVLMFYSNPKVLNQKVNIRCDIKMNRPDSTVALDQKDVNCDDGKLTGNPGDIYLALPDIRFKAEEKDPKVIGKWQVEVTLQDKIRGVRVPLKTSFTVR